MHPRLQMGCGVYRRFHEILRSECSDFLRTKMYTASIATLYIGTYYFLATIDLRPATSESITHHNISPYIHLGHFCPRFRIYSAPFIIEIDLARIYQTAAAVIARRILSPFAIRTVIFTLSSTTTIINCELYM